MLAALPNTISHPDNQKTMEEYDQAESTLQNKIKYNTNTDVLSLLSDSMLVSVHERRYHRFF
jgi:hypothetical protein